MSDSVAEQDVSAADRSEQDRPPRSLAATIYPKSPPLEEVIDCFWGDHCDFDSVVFRIEPPERPLALLERRGPLPCERGGVPVIGFLATTYDKVSRFAVERVRAGAS